LNDLYHDDWKNGSGRALFGHAYEDKDATFWESYSSLQWLNSVSSWQLKLITTSLLFFSILREIYAYKMYRGANKHFQKLSDVNKNIWINRVTSSIHAVISVLGATYVILIDDCKRQLWNNPVFGSTPVSEFFACISIGYFLYDLKDMISHPIPGLLGQIVHHICVLGAYWCSSTFHRGGIWVIYSLMMEYTTPFLNIRWFMAKYQMKQGLWYVLNGVALTSGFLIFRILLHILMFWHVWDHFEECTKVAKFILVSFLMEMVGVFVLNSYWFFLLMRGAWRILTKSNNKEVIQPKAFETSTNQNQTWVNKKVQ